MKHYTSKQNVEYFLNIIGASAVLLPIVTLLSISMDSAGMSLLALLVMLATSLLFRYCRPARRLYIKFLIATRRK